MSKETELLKALQRFETRIIIDAMDVSPNILSDAIAQNVKIAYYLAGISASIAYLDEPKIILNVQYKNMDVSQNDIYVVSTGEEVHSVLCQYIGNYKTRLVLFAKTGVNIDFEYQRFSVVSAPFYSNYLGTSIKKCQSSVINMSVYDFYFDYRIGKVKLAMMENETDAEIARISKQLFLPGMSNETKAFLAHNYLAHTIDYTLIEDANSLEKSYMQSAYGALIKKKCVCQGYAEAFKRLMDYAGILCDIVCGQTKGSTTYHAWNILKLNEERENYHIDVTWDSSGERVSYTYFGLKDSDFAGERTWNKEFNAKCNSSKNLLLEARLGIMRFKSQLIANGVSTQILGY